jgi:hypothetical protein
MRALTISLLPLTETKKLTSNLREMNMKACKEAEEVGSGKTAPALLLLSEDGEVVEGKRCTGDKCFNEE